MEHKKNMFMSWCQAGFVLNKPDATLKCMTTSSIVLHTKCQPHPWNSSGGRASSQVDGHGLPIKYLFMHWGSLSHMYCIHVCLYFSKFVVHLTPVFILTDFNFFKQFW